MRYRTRSLEQRHAFRSCRRCSPFAPRPLRSYIGPSEAVRRACGRVTLGLPWRRLGLPNTQRNKTCRRTDGSNRKALALKALESQFCYLYWKRSDTRSRYHAQQGGRMIDKLTRHNQAPNSHTVQVAPHYFGSRERTIRNTLTLYTE